MTVGGSRLRVSCSMCWLWVSVSVSMLRLMFWCWVSVGIALSLACLIILPSSTAAVLLSWGLGDSSSFLRRFWRCVSHSVISAIMSCLYSGLSLMRACMWGLVMPISSAMSFQVLPCMSPSVIWVALICVFSSCVWLIIIYDVFLHI